MTAVCTAPVFLQPGWDTFRLALKAELEPDVRMRFWSPGPGRVALTRRATSLPRL